MKRKFLLPILSICMVVALVSVGFAAWLITGNDTTSANGQFVTYDVSNQYFSVTTSVSSDITFGKPADVETNAPTYDWFQFADVVDENLSTTVTLTLKPEDKNYLDSVLAVGYKLKVTLKSGKIAEGTFSANADYDTAVSKNYLKLPTVESITLTGDKMETGLTFTLDITKKEGETGNFVVSDNGESASYTFTIKFGWGKFGGSTEQNPYHHYNNLDPSSEDAATNRANATEAMQAINKLANYEISLEVVNPSKSDS